MTKRVISAKGILLLVAFTPCKRFAIEKTPPRITVDDQLFIDFVRRTGELWQTFRFNPIHLNKVQWQMDDAGPHNSQPAKDFLTSRKADLLWQSP